MRWKTGRRSSNVEDRRGQMHYASSARGGGLMLLLRFLPMLLRSRGGRTLLIGGAVIIFGARLLGVDVLGLFSGQGMTPASSPAQFTEQEQELADFVSVVLADTEATWHEQFDALGRNYQEPTLVMFTGAVNSACGQGSAAMGPFYCPADSKVYIDLSFYQDLRQRHDAPGDFAQAYVIAHEVGHHVQNLLGISAQVQRFRQGASEAEANAMSVRLELQADCFAGLWGNMANSQRALLEQGDLEEALAAAAAIGDDRLQREAQGRVVPESFTHGTSAQRQRWFSAGFESGDFAACDTFAADSL